MRCGLGMDRKILSLKHPLGGYGDILLVFGGRLTLDTGFIHCGHWFMCILMYCRNSFRHMFK